VAIDESVVVIGPPGAELVGVLARPAEETAAKPVGVVIVVGGPQTRVGSHRQFVLMARALARAGYPCLRFDYTGMGDSPGPKPDFEHAGRDIRRACDAIVAAVPGCTKLALWGLCDGATAALFHAGGDARIAAVIAANPWARSNATHAAALVRRHYGSRVRSGEFWKKLLTGKVDIVATARETLRNVMRSRARAGASAEGVMDHDLPGRLASALASPRERVRVQLSGRDLTAAEFGIAVSAVRLSKPAQVTEMHLNNADHTFSDPRDWETVIADVLSQLADL
jgi:exosortase A-associated hydrolase 1